MIKLVVFDVDGVFSDKIYVTTTDGKSSLTKSYNPKDSYSLKILKNHGFKLGLVTGDDSDVLDHMEKLVSRVDFISKNNTEKLSIIKEWCEELDITLNEVAYIGDDIFDAVFMKDVGFSATPSDGVSICKLNAKYVCKNKGGDGAVREFAEKIIELNEEEKLNNDLSKLADIKANGKITAVIPVRSGSTRCKNKNIREFGDTDLLTKKIKILQQIPEIDEILVSSNDEKMLEIALKLGANIDRRDPFYARTETSGSELHHYIASKVKNPLMLYVHAVAPFVLAEHIRDIIKLYKTENVNSVMATHEIKNFLYQNNKPINYDPSNACISQDLKSYDIPVFTAIIDTDYVKQHRTLIGNKPLFYRLNQLEGIDIDTPYDFVVSELLYKNNFNSSADLDSHLKRVDTIKTEYLDCTIRDGGYINNWNFTDEEVIDCYKAVTNAGYDYFEIGFVRKDYDTRFGKYYSTPIETIKEIKNTVNGCKIAVMLEMKDNNNDYKLAEKEETGIDLIRLHTRFDSIVSENKINEILYDTQIITERFRKQNYEVCVNVGSITKYSNSLTEHVLSFLAKLDLKCIYLADTFGSLDEDSTRNTLYLMQNILLKNGSDIPLAFHAHNNMNDALAKAKVALNHRVKIVDSTVYGLGRGAGNLQTELLIMELNKRGLKYDLLPVLEWGDKYIRSWTDRYSSSYVYGNNPLYYLTGYFNIHPDYAKYVQDTYPDAKIADIYELFDSVKNREDYSVDKKYIDEFMD